ncbi:hypothetical protein OAT67_06790, partial [Bacteriovoracaceae bacterium]|nr:hypothetical protein [Bacteriovoracaceae bacterium]
ALSLVTLLTQASLSAAEVDSFTNRFTPIEDSLDLINKKSNEYFQQAMERANKKNKGCNEKRLYKSLRKYFRNHWTGEFNKWLMDAEEVDRITVSIRDGIYQDFKWYQAIIPGVYARVFRDPSAQLIKVNGVLLGWDKFEHFMGSGYNYFKKNYLKGKGIKEAMKIGYKAETGYMGAQTTGVKSYGDLIANFNGMRFWNHVLQKNDDVLGVEFNEGPYVQCVNDRWVQVKELDWSRYIDHAFDEGVNCSTFKNQKMSDNVEERISILEKNDTEGRKYGCPMLPLELEKATVKYGEFSKHLLNLEGHGPFK